MLRKLVADGASIEVYKLKSATGNELKIQYNVVLEKLNNDSYIPKDISAPAVNILCAGLGLDCTGFYTPTPTPMPPINQRSLPLPHTPTKTVPLNFPDFEIEGSVLKKYKGWGGDVTIPDFITTINGSAFLSFSNITSVTIPNSVTVIGLSAFASCTNLKSINIPNSVTEIEGSAFYNCTSLTSITLPNSLKTISYQMLKQCVDLTSVTIPNSVTDIKADAFKDCPNLDEATKNRLEQLGYNEKPKEMKTTKLKVLFNRETFTQI